MSYPHDMEAHTKVWIELDGKIVLGDVRVRLLELIGETGSLRDAATRVGMPYRRAWGKVRESEANLGMKLVESEIGGSGGGGCSRLTADAKRLITQYQRLSKAMDKHLKTEFARTFKA